MRNVIEIAKRYADEVSHPLYIATDPMTTGHVVSLLSRLCDFMDPHETYYEVGSRLGGTFIPVARKHSLTKIVQCCDTWEDEDARRGFRENVRDLVQATAQLNILHGDGFDAEVRRKVVGPIGVFFYDGDHSMDATRSIIEFMFPRLSNPFVLVMDDWKRNEVRRGTWQGINLLEPLEVQFIDCEQGRYHEGVGLFWVKWRHP